MENKIRVTKRIGKSVDFSNDIIKKNLSHKSGVRLLFNTLARYEDLEEEKMKKEIEYGNNTLNLEHSIDSTQEKLHNNLIENYYKLEEILFSSDNMTIETKLSIAWGALVLLVNSKIITSDTKKIVFGGFTSELMNFTN